MTDPTRGSPGPSESSPEANDPEMIRLQQGIEETRADMTATITALETRLSPSEVRDKIGVELQHVEDRVRGVVREQLDEAKALVKTELYEAKDLLRSEMNEAEQKIKKGLAEARDTVKSDIQEAISGAKRAVRAATLGKVENLATDIGDKMNETRDTLVDTIRNNPIPATMLGVGLAWLLMNRSSSAERRFTPGGNGGVRVKEAVSRGLHDATTAASNAMDGASGAASDLAHRAGDAASQLAHQAGDAASHLAHQAGDAAMSVGRGARRGAQRVEQGFQHTLQENPVAVGAAALALGAVVGFSLPRTDREDSLMGATRDRALHRASDAARDAAGAVNTLAEKAGEQAKESLQKGANA